MCSMAVEMSLGLGLAFRGRVALVGTRVAGAGTGFGLTGQGVLPLATVTNAADDGVGAGGNDGAVVIREGVCCAGNGREERVGRVAVPAGGGTFAHCCSMYSPWTDGTDAGVSILVFARGAAHVPEVDVVARKGLLNTVLAHEVMGVAQDVADVVAGPFAIRVCFEECAGVLNSVRLFAYADLSVPLPELHTATGRAVATLNNAGTVGFVKRDFLPCPINDSVGCGCLGEAVRLFVGE